MLFAIINEFPSLFKASGIFLVKNIRLHGELGEIQTLPF